jgi:hypothetical protein
MPLPPRAKRSVQREHRRSSEIQRCVSWGYLEIPDQSASRKFMLIALSREVVTVELKPVAQVRQVTSVAGVEMRRIARQPLRLLLVCFRSVLPSPVLWRAARASR